jgi:serine/threonine-protein kinase
MRQIVVVVLAVAAAFGLGAVLFNYVLMPRLVRHGSTVPVPAVTGLSLADAQRACGRVALQLVEDDRAHSPELPAGHVVSQLPAAGTPVKPGRTVRVTVSLGQQHVVVPDLRGMSERQAALALHNAQLVLGRAAIVHTGSAGRTVRATRPPAGSQAGVGDSVTVLVATGEAVDRYWTPDLVGQDIEAVRALLESRGFRVGRVSYRSDSADPGTVLEHVPPRGAMVHRGDAFDLVVAAPH